MQPPSSYVTMSYFRYPWQELRWAMARMHYMQAPLRQVEGLRFFKLLGTGGGKGYSFWPDLGTWALLAAWENEAAAVRYLAEHAAHRDVLRHAHEAYTLHLAPIQSRGAWSGVSPFSPVPAPPPGPLAVLTRATIRPSFAPAFWWRVGRVARSLEGRDDLLFTKGVGERPWVEQATFSVWRSTEAMQAFAHGRGGMHAEAIARTRKAQGFREELYARFTVLRTEGSWKGGDPVRG
jgi:hypothetical protein